MENEISQSLDLIAFKDASISQSTESNQKTLAQFEEYRYEDKDKCTQHVANSKSDTCVPLPPIINEKLEYSNQFLPDETTTNTTVYREIKLGQLYQEFKCPYCDIEFRDKNGFTLHISKMRNNICPSIIKARKLEKSGQTLSHPIIKFEKDHNLKQVSCNQCTSVFNTEQNLSRHKVLKHDFLKQKNPSYNFSSNSTLVNNNC